MKRRPGSQRDEFSPATRRHLARSVNYHCSHCGAPTAGPYSGGGKSITTGQAAHICAAAPKGPRPDKNMTPEQRSHYDNGIWLCAAHAPLIDVNWPRYTVEQLREMKKQAEAKAAADLEHAKVIADLRAVLEDRVRWNPPSPHENRPGYEGLYHVAFTLAGVRKERGRAYIEVRTKGQLTEHYACISREDRKLEHEWRDLRPGEPCRIPVYTQIAAPTMFWLDSQLRSDPAEPPDVVATGTYITDRPFLERHSRVPLAPATYRLRVRLVLGDSNHPQPFVSEWKKVIVSGLPGSSSERR